MKKRPPVPVVPVSTLTAGKMCGDAIAFQHYRKLGYSPEDADRLAGQAQLAKYAGKVGSALALDPAPSFARMAGCSIEQAQAAIDFERRRGGGTGADKADRLAQHLTERPNYYGELASMLEVPMAKAATLRELLEKAEEKKDSGGWEAGPRGGTRKKVGDKWVYKGKGGEGGKAPAEKKEGEGDAPADEEAGPKVAGKTQSQLPGADLIAEQGAKAIEAIRKEDPAKAADVQRALNHVVAGLRQRQKGRGTPESDKSLVDALKDFGRSFSQSAAPASVLGPDLGGLLEASQKADARNAATQKDEERQAKLEQDTKHATSKVVAAAQKVAEVAKPGSKSDEKEPVKKAEGTRWGIGIQLGGRDRLDDIPDYQGIFHAPRDAAAVKLEEQHITTRRRGSAKQITGGDGFFGAPKQQPEPQLRFVLPKGQQGPKVRATDTKDRREAGAPYRPKSPGEIIRHVTDRGRVPRTAARGADGAAPTDKRPKPRLTAKMCGGKAEKATRKRDRFDVEAEVIVAKMTDKQVGRWDRGQLTAFISAGFRNSDALGFTKSDVVLDALYKGQTRGGKYTKRVPYTDAKGRRRYRYYYAESAVARDVKAGESIRLGKRLVKVESVDEDGTVHLVEPDGRKLAVKSGDWGTLLSRHYGARYFEWAEKRASQSVNAVLRHVPKKLLGDLKGATDAERMRDLQRRVPAVYAKLEASFARAGVNPERAKSILSASLERRGWEPEARAAVIGSVITQRTGPDRVQEVIRGAENLAAGARVTVSHVGALIELRGPRGGDARTRIDAIAKKAEAELVQLAKVLEAAKAGGDLDKAEALADVLASSSVQKLMLLVQAFPGLRDRAIEPAREALLGAPAVAPSPKPKLRGSEAVLFVAEAGRPKALKATYRLMEAGDVKASHDPTRGFQQRKDYPGGVQERAYHRDKDEQAKVIMNAQKLEPAFVINTNPDAVNGPPMITPDGVALGGNSRTMSMQKAYADHPEKAAAMRDYLSSHAHEFGFTEADVGALKHPILVREVSPEEGRQQHTPDEMRLLVRQMNESFTQGMDPRTMQVALGRKIDDKTLDTLATSMEDGESLAAFLGSKRAESFIKSLSDIGLIDARNQAQYVKKTKGTRKELNEDGKTLVERVLVGRLVGDADVLSNTRARIVSNLARTVPYLAQAKSAGAGYDLGPDMVEAVKSLNLLQTQQDAGVLTNKMSPKMNDREFASLFGQMTIGSAGIDIPAATNPRAKILLELLIRKPGPIQLANVFKSYAKAANANPEGSMSLLGASEEADPMGTLKRVVAAALKGKPKEEPKEEPPATASLF